MVSTEIPNLSICSRPYFDYRLNYSLGRFWKYEHVVSVWKENTAKQAWCRLYKFSSIKSEQAYPKFIYAWVWWNAKDTGVHKLFSSNRTKQAYSKFNFPSNMPIRLATTLRKDCFYNPDICVVFMEQKKKTVNIWWVQTCRQQSVQEEEN